MIAPPSKPPHMPLENPTTAAGKRLVELHKGWTEQYDRALAVESDYRAAQAALSDADATLREVLTEAELKGGKPTKAVTDAEAAYAKAKAEAEAPWEQRAQAAKRASDGLRAPFEAHVTEHLDEVLSEPELADEAETARDEVLGKAEGLQQAIERWQRSRRAHSDIVAPAEGITGQSIPFLTGSASAVAAAVDGLLAAQKTGRPAGGNPLPLPCPSKSDLTRRAVARGEAEEVPVDGGVRIVRNA